MFRDAIDQMEDEDYIDKLHKRISGLENDIDMVDQQNLSIMKTAEKFKRKSESLQVQNERYRGALEEILDSSTNDIAEFIARKTLEESK